MKSAFVLLMLLLLPSIVRAAEEAPLTAPPLIQAEPSTEADASPAVPESKQPLVGTGNVQEGSPSVKSEPVITLEAPDDYSVGARIGLGLPLTLGSSAAAGIVGATAGGLAGFLIGLPFLGPWAVVTGLVGIFVGGIPGLVVGAMLGPTLAGKFVSAPVSVGGSVVGALVGTAAGVTLIAATSRANVPVLSFLALAMPAVGAVVGQELALLIRGSSGETSAQLDPLIAPSADGRGLAFGFSGAF